MCSPPAATVRIAWRTAGCLACRVITPRAPARMVDSRAGGRSHDEQISGGPIVASFPTTSSADPPRRRRKINEYYSIVDRFGPFQLHDRADRRTEDEPWLVLHQPLHPARDIG